jgi:hypothetical protein
MLELLLVRGLHLESAKYREIARPAIERAFERDFDGRLGHRSLREAIAEASELARGGAFDVLAEEFLGFVHRVRLDDKPGWYLPQLRETLQSLLANPDCTESADDLATALRDVNQAQRRRPQMTGQAVPIGSSGRGAA